MQDVDALAAAAGLRLRPFAGAEAPAHRRTGIGRALLAWLEPGSHSRFPAATGPGSARRAAGAPSRDLGRPHGGAARPVGLPRAVRALRAQREAGMRDSELGVDSENADGASRVYADCGFREVKRNTVYRKPFMP